MKVLVTGGTGFIGSWLVRKLLEEGAEVTALVKKNDPLGLGNIGGVKDGIKIIYGDIRDSKEVKKAAKDKELVFHLAAITQVTYSIECPKETFDVNAAGTLNVLEAMRECNENAFLVIASTDKVYGEPVYLPIDEEHPLLGKSPYDASKIAADRMAYSYHKTYGTKVSIIRCSNIYGGADSNILRAVPDFTYAILKNKQPVIRGNGMHKRDFLYVDDAVNAYMSVAKNQSIANGETFNFGTSMETSVKELARLMAKIAGVKTEPRILGMPLKGEIEKQRLSYRKAKRLLNWKPSTNIEEGLRKTMLWYRENKWWSGVVENVSRFYGIEEYK